MSGTRDDALRIPAPLPPHALRAGAWDSLVQRLEALTGSDGRPPVRFPGDTAEAEAIRAELERRSGPPALKAAAARDHRPRRSL